jgi:hypothetical protein
MPDPVSRLRLARDEIDKTFGVGFAASRACCRRLGGRLTAPPAQRNHWNGHPSSDAVLVPVSPGPVWTSSSPWRRSCASGPARGVTERCRAV